MSRSLKAIVGVAVILALMAGVEFAEAQRGRRRERPAPPPDRVEEEAGINAATTTTIRDGLLTSTAPQGAVTARDRGGRQIDLATLSRTGGELVVGDVTITADRFGLDAEKGVTEAVGNVTLTTRGEDGATFRMTTDRIAISAVPDPR